ncbi:MAG TPA: aminotransferase class IV [Candidatus Polarisedimenticolia bacterium]|nr:aminotransferase class IV [Candidatus Polarisedimenticolia bacterium]
MSDIELANVNGTISAVGEACIPVNDHGFLYGDSVYETVRTYGGRPFLVERHLERLSRSAAAIRLPLPWSFGHVRSEMDRTLARAPGAGERALRIMATRGPGPLGYDPALCPSPTLVILLRTLRPPAADQRERGLSAAIVPVRRNPIESLDPRIKSSNLLNNILAAQQAKDAGADEAILFNTAGHLAEGTNTNVFFVSDGTLRTPSLDCGLLSGVTREVVLELAAEAAIPAEEGRYGEQALRSAREIFLTSTTREIVPIAVLDGRAVGEGRRGPVTARLQSLFDRRVASWLDAPEGAR